MVAARKLAGALVLATVLSSVALAQGLEEKRAAKLAEAWVKEGGWISDYDKARKLSEESGKPIFAYFTRSYSP
jgi:hypothetical protein